MRSRLITCIVALAMAGAAFVFTDTLVHATLYASDGSAVALVAPGDTGTGAVSAGSPIQAVSAATKTTIVTSPDDPARLIIPALSINANVQDIGINAKGNLGVPNNFTDVGWYALGVRPGQPGSAVIDGHVDNGLSLAGVFKKLNTIQTGDDIYVTTEGGTKLHFTVTSIAWYDYADAASTTSAIFTQTGGTYLKLITCGGAWVPSDNTYDHRLMVTAVLSS